MILRRVKGESGGGWEGKGDVASCPHALRARHTEEMTNDENSNLLQSEHR